MPTIRIVCGTGALTVSGAEAVVYALDFKDQGTLSIDAVPVERGQAWTARVRLVMPKQRDWRQRRHKVLLFLLEGNLNVMRFD